MRLGIDWRPALFGRAGIARCTREICRALPELLAPGEEAVLYGVAFRRPEAFAKEAMDPAASGRVKAVQARFPNRLLHLLSRLGLAGIETFTGPLDLFLYTDFVYPPLRRAPYCIILYDLLFLHEGQGYHSAAFCGRMGKRIRAALRRTRGVIVPSMAVKSDLERFFPEADAPVRVIPLAGDHLPPPVRPVEASGLEAGRYFLSVGTLEPRKNRLRLIRAFEEAAPALEGIRLVVAGRPGWMDEPFLEHLNASPVRERVLLLRDVEDAGLAWLYRNALALVYPSLGEGFGLPLAEAMTEGCPVVTSDCSAMPEVVRGAAVLVDPLDTAGLAGAMRKLSAEGAVREGLIRDGHRRAQELSWRATSKEILDFLRELCGAGA